MILIVTTLRVLFLSAAMVRACSPANLAVSTYFNCGQGWERCADDHLSPSCDGYPHPVESKAKVTQCPDHIFPRDGRVRGHQTSPTRRFSSLNFAAASGICFWFASMDLI